MKPEINFSGMTVNERLFAAGLISEWDHAAHSRDRHRMIELLCKVDLSRDAERVCDAILANPQLYGL
jgi:hypothetical protein